LRRNNWLAMKPLSEIEAALDKQGEELAWDYAFDYVNSKSSFKAGRESLKGPLLDAIEALKKCIDFEITDGCEECSQIWVKVWSLKAAEAFLEKTKKELGLK